MLDWPLFIAFAGLIFSALGVFWKISTNATRTVDRLDETIRVTAAAHELSLATLGGQVGALAYNVGKLEDLFERLDKKTNSHDVRLAVIESNLKQAGGS